MLTRQQYGALLELGNHFASSDYKTFGYTFDQRMPLPNLCNRDIIRNTCKIIGVHYDDNSLMMKAIWDTVALGYKKFKEP